MRADAAVRPYAEDLSIKANSSIVRWQFKYQKWPYEWPAMILWRCHEFRHRGADTAVRPYAEDLSIKANSANVRWRYRHRKRPCKWPSVNLSICHEIRHRGRAWQPSPTQRFGYFMTSNDDKGHQNSMAISLPVREGVAALPYTEFLGHAGAIMSNPSRFGRTRRSASPQSSQSLSYLLHRYARRQYTHDNLRHVQSTRGHRLSGFENPTRKQPHE